MSFREIRPEECLEGFRTVRVPTIGHLDLPLSFQSHYDEGLEPRFQQIQHAALHRAVSFWRNRETALEVARMFFPKHGEYMAHVVLTFGHGFDCLDPEAEPRPQHLTIWGHPERLALAVVDIFPVQT